MNARQTFLHYLHFLLFGFKIKPEDFHNVSASRNEGSSLTSNEAGSISDAKVAKFFGINKKTPQKIAVKRHAKRDADKIQQAWNARRIANIEESVKNGLLPKECLTGLSALKQEELNARISFWQKTAARHAARTSQEIAAIKQRWAEKQLCDKEKALADLIPEVHGWHNTSASQNCAKPTAIYKALSTIGKSKDTTSPQTATSIRSWRRWSKNQIRGEPRSIQSRTQSAQDMANSAGRILRITRQWTK